MAAILNVRARELGQSPTGSAVIPDLSLHGGCALPDSRNEPHKAPVTRLPAHKTILLVEDDLDIAEAILDILQSAGRSAEYARDGVDALQKLEVLERPCLILLDLMMPRMDGLEFLQRLRERVDSEDFPVLVISAHGVLTPADYPGVLGVLQKPFDAKQLLKVVQQHC